MDDSSDRAPLEAILPVLYDDLRRMARARIGDTPGRHTLQATELVHEVYVRLADRAGGAPVDRSHLVIAAARSMRDILVERARRRCAKKRGEGRAPRDLETIDHAATAQPQDVLAIDELLARFDVSTRELVELRFYGGMSLPEIAEWLDQPLRSLERRWHFLKVRLAAALAADEGGSR